MHRARGPKDKLFDFVNRLPLLGEMADPIVASVLLVLVSVTIFGLASPHAVFPHDHTPRSHILQAAGGLLVVFAAYYSAIALRDRRAHEYLDRLAKALSDLASDSVATRVGAIRLLQSLALERPVLPPDSTTIGALRARKAAIWEALSALDQDESSVVQELAGRVRNELTRAGFTTS